MVSVSVNNMQRILQQTGLYRLNNNGPTDAELSAYDVGFKIIEDKLDELLKENFVKTATIKGLLKFEQMLVMPDRVQSDPDIRREIISHQLDSVRTKFDLKSYIKIINGAGFYPVIIEDAYQKKISIDIDRMIDPTITIEEMLNYIENAIPAHIGLVFDYGGLNFDQLDQKISNWNLWDLKDFDWNNFDLNNHEIFA